SAASSSVTPFSSFFSSSFGPPFPSFLSEGSAAGAANVSAFVRTSARLTPSSEARSALTRTPSGAMPAAERTPLRPFSSIGFPAAFSNSAPYTYSIFLTPSTSSSLLTCDAVDGRGLADRLGEQRGDGLLGGIAGRDREPEGSAVGLGEYGGDRRRGRIADLDREHEGRACRAPDVGPAGIEVDREDLRRVEHVAVHDGTEREPDLEREDVEAREETGDLARDRLARLHDRGVLLQDDLALLDRGGEAGVLELSHDGPRLEARGPCGNEDVVGRDLASPRGRRGPRAGQFVMQRERVPFRGKERGLVLDLGEERAEGRALGGGLLEGVADRAVGRDHDRVLALPHPAAHRLQRGGRDAPDADEGSDRLGQELVGEDADARDLLRRDLSATRHRFFLTRGGPPGPSWS